MNTSSTYRIKGRVVLRRIGEDRLLVPASGDAARENCVFPINETGEFIWEHMAKGLPLDQVAQALAAAFEVSPAEALSDCRQFAGDLLVQGLLEEVRP